MLRKNLESFIFAWKGLQTVWREEDNFRIEIFAAVLIIFSIFYFNFSFIESSLAVIAVTVVLCAEIINTAIEDLCNKIEPNRDPVIGKIKDTAGAFVLVSVLGSFIVGVLVFYNHFL